MPVHKFGTPQAALDHQLAREKKFKVQVIRPAQLESANRTLRKVVRASPRDRGEYALGWTVSQSYLRHGIQLRNDAPHAGIIERGARPFWPPIAPLIEWARRKAGDLSMAGHFKIGSQAFRTDKKGNLRYRGQASLDPDDEGEVESFAYGVQRAIAARGLPPRYIMRNRLPFALKALDSAMRKHIRKFAEGGES